MPILARISRHDVAIYAPGAAVYYDRAARTSGGGAERQTVLLARALAAAGLRVAHIVGPVADPVATPVTLVSRPEPSGYGSARAFAERLREVWRALDEADARTQVFRGAQGNLGVAALWSRVHRRRLVFSGANESDFAGGSFDGPRDPRAKLYDLGVRLSDAVVVQSDVQAALCRDRYPRAAAAVPIRSFVEPQPQTKHTPEAFLWVSRLADYKRPLAYADLAAAVPEARFWMIAIETPHPWHAETLALLQRRAAELPNLELLAQRPHAELQQLMEQAVAMVNTSSFEGVPNTWLEGWARGVPALSLSFDPDNRIAARGLGAVCGDDAAAFAAAARDLWTTRGDRGDLSAAVRAYVDDVHGERVTAAWLDAVQP